MSVWGTVCDPHPDMAITPWLHLICPAMGYSDTAMAQTAVDAGLGLPIDTTVPINYVNPVYVEPYSLTSCLEASTGSNCGHDDDIFIACVP